MQSLREWEDLEAISPVQVVQEVKESFRVQMKIPVIDDPLTIRASARLTLGLSLSQLFFPYFWGLIALPLVFDRRFALPLGDILFSLMVWICPAKYIFLTLRSWNPSDVKGRLELAENLNLLMDYVVRLSLFGGMCRVVAALSGLGTCRDIDPGCTSWAAMGRCEAYRNGELPEMLNFCALACKVCDPSDWPLALDILWALLFLVTLTSSAFTVGFDQASARLEHLERRKKSAAKGKAKAGAPQSSEPAEPPQPRREASDLDGVEVAMLSAS